jgi:hypothetical protein
VLSGKQFPTDPEPLFSPLPLLDNIAAASGLDSAAGAWLVDTGAQISMISGALAQALNIDYLTPTASGGDQLDVLAVGGVGGDVAVPLVSLDSLTLTDNNGDSLVVHDIIVGVLDVEGLPVDGILGSNLLTSGYIEQLFAPEVSFGMFTDVVFDFTGGTWTMRLDRNPDYEIVDAGLSPTELQGLLDTQVAFLTSAAWPWSIDTVSVIPEPASLMLLAPAMMMLRRRRR